MALVKSPTVILETFPGGDSLFLVQLIDKQNFEGDVFLRGKVLMPAH